MQVEVTQEAAGYIRERGGRVYSGRSPWGRTGLPIIGVELELAKDLGFPPQLQRIKLGRIPRRLHVDWDGERWGWRGGGEGPSGGG